MSINTYTSQIPLPAPVTTGTTLQSYQDPNGDMWVAKNGVRGGAWRRAADCLRARVHRAAAITAGSAGTFNWMQYDTKTWDEYGMMTLNIASPGAFTCPLSGFWWAETGVATSGITTQRAFAEIFKNGAEMVRGADLSNGLTLSSVAMDIIQLNAGDTLGSVIWVTSSLACFVGSPYCYFTVEYHGTPIGS